MAAYYNEHDPFAAAWLRELIKAGLIADGEVDERDIQDVQPGDVRGFTQCHFFAGIGGWAYALSLAGYPDDRPVWTGSCPCQPFSVAGKRQGAADARHLWPAWFRLIRECRPDELFGEQVASVDGLAWFDAVSTDLEGADYAVGAADLCAASVGAPHIRQRLWFVAASDERRRRAYREHRRRRALTEDGRVASHDRSATQDAGASGELAESRRKRCEGERLHIQPGQSSAAGVEVGGRRETGELGNPTGARRQPRASERQEPSEEAQCVPATSSPWAACDWIECRDGKARPVEPGTFPLAHGLPARVGRLRGYGNAIVPQVAAEFIQAYREICEAF